MNDHDLSARVGQIVVKFSGQSLNVYDELVGWGESVENCFQPV